MTAHGTSRGGPAASPDELASAVDAAASATFAEQVDRLARDLAAHRRLSAASDPLARGAALAAAHGALALATAPLASPAERALRRVALNGAMPELAGAGLGHVTDLVTVALALEPHPVALTRDRGARQ